VRQRRNFCLRYLVRGTLLCGPMKLTPCGLGDYGTLALMPVFGVVSTTSATRNGGSLEKVANRFLFQSPSLSFQSLIPFLHNFCSSHVYRLAIFSKWQSPYVPLSHGIWLRSWKGQVRAQAFFPLKIRNAGQQ
jgi:hypothetical protein